jgi:DNA-binding ferritin-like protein
MEAMLQNNHIKEFGMSEAVPQALDMWKIIRDDWDKLIRSIRDIHKQIPENDLATLNFLEDMIESMEKEAWMVRSYNVTPTGI